ncbi:TonB-dependent siderophore receptor [Tianweitania populi]|uniref:TonB-dependent siderophore receptor n=1 Tax=Tianweitania populi TaxID=1607949 RepID=UPI001672D2C2|nr:TonB-dependent siderophore receptor [Tianweitania populi]
MSRTSAVVGATAGLLTALSCSTALAQTPVTLDQVVVNGEGEASGKGPVNGLVAKRSASASKTDTPLLETPQAVSVVSREQIDAQGAGSVSQALRYTPGVLSDPNGQDIRYDWLYIRGFSTYGTMWLDGLNLPGDPNNYAVPTINPYALERVEVIKGPASVMYGRAVPGGLINQVSKRPQAETHREVSIATNGFGGLQGSVDMTGKLTEDGTWLYRFAGQAKNLHTQIDHERDRQVMLAPSITWAPTDDTSLTLYGYYQHDVPVFSPRFYPAPGTLLPNPAGQIPRDVFLGDPNWGEFNRDFYSLGYEFEHAFNETWTVRQNLRYSAAKQNMDLVLVNPAFAYNGPGTTLSRVTAIAEDDLSNFAVDSQAEARFETGALDHTALMGLDYVRTRSSTNFGNTGPGVAVPPIDYLNPVYGFDFPRASFTRSGLQVQNQVGVYAQDQIRYDRWVGTFGLRYDVSDIDSDNRLSGSSVTTRDEALTGRAGITYLFDNGIAPYASVSTSFLPQLGTDRLGQPFEALTARQFEVGIKYEPTGGRGMIGVSLFDMRIENGLTNDPINTLFSVQTGKQRVRGIELEGKYEITPSLAVLGSYAFSDSEVLESNNPRQVGRALERLPEHQGSVWVSYQPSYVDGLSLMAGVRATSSYNADTNRLAQLKIPDRALVDIGAEFDFGALNETYEGTRLKVGVTNLFDEKYVSHCLNATGGSCNYGAARTFTASLKYEW